MQWKSANFMWIVECCQVLTQPVLPDIGTRALFVIFNSAEHSWLLPQNLQGSGPHPPIRIWNPICNLIFSSLISELQRKHFKTIILCPLKSQHQMNTNTQSLSSTVMARNFLTCVQGDSSRSSSIDSKEPVLAFLSPTLKKCMRA